MRSAVWFITMQCQNYCPYCWERQQQKKGEFKPEPFIDYQKWVTAWNKILPATLDITGGEPFLQPGFIDMIEGFDRDIRVAITTNMQSDLTEFVNRISPSKVFHITASYHPSGPMNKDLFIGKCIMLKQRGFGVSVNFVTYPEQMWMSTVLANEFRAFGLQFHIDPWCDHDNRFKYTDKERVFLNSITGNDRAHFTEDVDKRMVECNAGLAHLSVQPNGDAYRCINDKIFNKGKIGNILDPKFKVPKEWVICPDYWRCAGCDKDKVDVKYIREEGKN